jgi:hypothetical protein
METLLLDLKYGLCTLVTNRAVTAVRGVHACPDPSPAV